MVPQESAVEEDKEFERQVKDAEEINVQTYQQEEERLQSLVEQLEANLAKAEEANNKEEAALRQERRKREQFLDGLLTQYDTEMNEKTSEFEQYQQVGFLPFQEAAIWGFAPQGKRRLPLHWEHLGIAPFRTPGPPPFWDRRGLHPCGYARASAPLGTPGPRLFWEGRGFHPFANGGASAPLGTRGFPPLWEAPVFPKEYEP